MAVTQVSMGNLFAYVEKEYTVLAMCEIGNAQHHCTASFQKYFLLVSPQRIFLNDFAPLKAVCKKTGYVIKKNHPQ
jgi:hypothetical protein